MVYRKIKDEEAKDFANLSATAFFSNAQNAYNDIEKGEFLTETIRVLEDKHGRFLAGLRLFEIAMYLDTDYVKTGGIGDVSSYPENRRSGNVSKLFNNALREMYEDGYIMSYLYPFSHPFYRKYGYELCRKKDTVTLKADSITYSEDTGYVKQHVHGGKEDLTDDVKQIYSKYSGQMNFMLDRKGWFWDRILNEDAYTSKSRLYVFYFTDGTPAAYFQYDYEKIDFITFNAKIFDIAFVNREAFDMVLRFIYKLAPSVKEVTFACPPILDALGIIDEPWHVNIKSEAGGMMRIINVEQVLGVIKAPMIRTTLHIKVNDVNIKENNDIFRIDINSGSSIVKRDSACVSPDLECSIHILNQLVSGYAGLGELIHRKDIKINSKYDDLSNLFIRKPIHTQDHF